MNRSVDWQGTINTFSGLTVDLRNPTPAMINRYDIAAGLARLCRWSGQCRYFYSVAQHSVLVAREAPPAHKLTALLHDATEAYIGDVARPLKDLLPEYRKIEDRLWWAIASKFSLPHELPPEVKLADDVLLVTERRDLMPRAAAWGWEGAPAPLAAKIEPWSVKESWGRWLGMLEQLTRED